MNGLSVTYLLDAIDEAQDYYQLLENQESINHVVVQHSFDALNQIFKQYKKEH